MEPDEEEDEHGDVEDSGHARTGIPRPNTALFNGLKTDIKPESVRAWLRRFRSRMSTHDKRVRGFFAMFFGEEDMWEAIPGVAEIVKSDEMERAKNSRWVSG